MDLETEQWHRPILEEFRINEAILPKICSNCEVYGHVHSGPLAGVPIAGSLGDQQASLLGRQSHRKHLQWQRAPLCRSSVQTRRGEKYIRHWMFSPPQYRDTTRAFNPWPHHWNRLQIGSPSFYTVYVRRWVSPNPACLSICICARICCHCGFPFQLAERQLRNDSVRRGGRRSRQDRRRYWRRLLRAGIQWSLSSPLARRRSRNPYWTDRWVSHKSSFG